MAWIKARDVPLGARCRDRCGCEYTRVEKEAPGFPDYPWFRLDRPGPTCAERVERWDDARGVSFTVDGAHDRTVGFVGWDYDDKEVITDG